MNVTSKTLSFVAIMTALCVGSNYALIGVPNVKFMDLFVFVSGYLAGSLSGMTVGFLTWLVYGTLNPYGFDLPTLLATSIGETIYGIAGGLMARSGLRLSSDPSAALTERSYWGTSLRLGMLGFLLTFAYDLFTNVVTGTVFGIPLVLWIVQGVPYTVAHEVSNFFFFLAGGNVLINAIRRIMCKGGES